MAKIIVADHSIQMRKITKRFLEKEGHCVDLASNGQDVLDILHKPENDTCLVIMGIDMPVMGGISCLGRIRNLSKKLPVIICSGILNFQELVPDAEGHLGKPYLKHELLQVVRSTLGT